MIIGVGLDGRLGLSVAELGELGEEAARLGFESLWTPAGGVPDAFHVCARWAETTERIVPGGLRIGTAVVPVARMWHPASLAAQAATVAQMSNGHFILGIGTGGYGDAFFSGTGLPNRPVAVMRDYISLVRALLSGDRVDYDGAALSLHGFSLGTRAPAVPIYIAALGPQMLRLAGAIADGVSLNWATPERIAESRALLAEGAARASCDSADVTVSMYIRVCVDDDVAAARRAFGAQVLSYGLARPGIDTALGYRGHFGRMGFEEALSDLEARRDKGAKIDELVELVPDELLNRLGYFGPPDGAAARYAELSKGLDETIVRVITTRPGVEPALVAMRALTPELIRQAS